MTSPGQGQLGRSRGRAAGVLAAGLAAMSVLAAPGSDAGAQAERGGSERPNFLVVMTDDQRADDVQVMREVKRRIASRGTTFRNAFATFPLCCPSRATYLTGQYAHNHNVRHNVPPEGGVTAFVDDDETTVVALREAGYRTGWIGKYLNGYSKYWNDTGYVPPGYDVWRPLISGFTAYDWKQLIDGEKFEWGRTMRDYNTDVYGRQAKQFIRASADEAAPFFLTVAPNAPHREAGGGKDARHNPRPARRHKDQLEGYPFAKTKAFNELDVSDKPSFVRETPRLTRHFVRRTEKQRLARLESLLAVDDIVNSVIRTLKKSGELSNTIVIFTSDNGFQLAEHRLGSKNRIYEESIRVPLVMRGPGVPAGNTVRSPAANLDVAATIYDLAGVDPLVPQDGISLFELIEDPDAFEERELLIETTLSRALRTPGFLYAEHDSDSETPGVADELELYDLANDPHQLESIHDDFGPGTPTVQERAAMAARLEQLSSCAGANCH